MVVVRSAPYIWTRIGPTSRDAARLDPMPVNRAAATASNFGKVRSDPTQADKALALINMVAEVTFTLSLMAARARQHHEIVLTGKLTRVKRLRDRFEAMQPRRGETVKAVVVLKEEREGQVSADDIMNWSRLHMAAYKVPRLVDFVDQLPRSGTGKIQWRALQEKEWEGVAKG